MNNEAAQFHGKVRWHAFTLIESLIVVAIISILGALLFPMAQKALSSAKSAQCVSRQKQVGAALLSYSADHNGLIPPRYGVGTTKMWHDFLCEGGYLGPKGGSSREEQKKQGIFFCPDFPLGRTGDLMSYGMRRWRTPGAKDLDDTQNLRILPNPSNFWLIADSIFITGETQGYFIGTGESPWAIRFSHADRANTLFADGHVEPKSREYFDEARVEQSNFGVIAPWPYWPK